MDLTVLAVPDCPNVMLLEERLAQVLEGRRDVSVSRQVIAEEDEAARWGMHGSPTILVDGIDPFAGPGQSVSVSCRLYRDGGGQADGAPSVSQLRQAIGGAAATAATRPQHVPADHRPHRNTPPELTSAAMRPCAVRFVECGQRRWVGGVRPLPC